MTAADLTIKIPRLCHGLRIVGAGERKLPARI